MDETPNRTRPNASAPSYPYVQETFPQFVPHSSWINTQPHTANNSQPYYGGPYFPYVAQPGNISTSPSSQTRTENASPTSSTQSSNAYDSDSIPIAPNVSEIGAKGNTTTRWREEQTTVLVHEWKERIEELESSRATETWHHIVNAVNKAGTAKSVKQCKNKIRNLKQAYKEAKANNNRTGSSPKKSPFFDTFDDVLGTRAVVTMPGVIQSDSVPYETATLLNQSDDEESDDSDTESTSSPEQNATAKRKKQPEKPARKQKKARVTAATAMVDLTEKLVEMQRSQAELMAKAQSRTEELMLKMEMEQRKLDEESRRRDQEFFLRMAEIMKK
jgi:hypothetical protein